MTRLPAGSAETDLLLVNRYDSHQRRATGDPQIPKVGGSPRVSVVPRE